MKAVTYILARDAVTPPTTEDTAEAVIVKNFKTGQKPQTVEPGMAVAGEELREEPNCGGFTFPHGANDHYQKFLVVSWPLHGAATSRSHRAGRSELRPRRPVFWFCAAFPTPIMRSHADG